MPRRQPKIVVGGSIFRAQNGYLAIPQYTPMLATQMTVQQIYSNARQRRYPPSWDGKAPDAKQLIYLTDPFTILGRCCRRSLGRFLAYEASGEYGLIRNDAKQRHPVGNFPPDQFANQPNDAFEPKKPTFWVDGEVGGHTSKAFACFRCPKCEHTFNPRNLRKFGLRLFGERPSPYVLPLP